MNLRTEEFASTVENVLKEIRENPPVEAVNHPAHYNSLSAVCDKCGDLIECIEVVGEMNFNLGNAIKYIWRAGDKDKTREIEDLKKAQKYLEFEIIRLQKLKG